MNEQGESAVSDLISQMVSDSGQTEDHLDKLNDTKLDAVARLNKACLLCVDSKRPAR